jgi:hypothetical protein
VDIYIQKQHWPAQRGQPKPTLVVALGTLIEICERESGIFGEGDGPRFANALAMYAKESGGSDDDDITKWQERCDALLVEIEEEE